VRSVTTRTVPSSPGCNSVILASGHRVGDITSERTRHKSPMLGPAEFLVHFGLEANDWRYSRDHRCQ